MRRLAYLFLLFATVSHGSELRYARNFSIERFATHKELTVRNTWIGSGERKEVYALVPRGAVVPDLPADRVVIRTPARRLVVMETVFLGSVDDLDLYDSLIGVPPLDYTSNDRVHQLVALGQAREIRFGMATDIESLMLLQADLMLTSTIGDATFDVHPQMLRAGLPVVVTAGYMEKHPLARTEWIKFVAAFYDREVEAAAIFDQIAARYESLVALAQSAATRPTVFASAPFSGSWHMPGGDSYMATALQHAGADFLWSDLRSSGGVPLDLEVIVQRASTADFWINPSHYTSVRQLLSSDQRFAGFRAVRNKNVFNKTLRENERGGNDIFERGVSHPEEVLADLIKIFHPELLPEHDFVFYQRLP